MTDNTSDDHRRARIAKEASEGVKLIRRNGQFYVRINGELIKVNPAAQEANGHRFSFRRRRDAGGAARAKVPAPTQENTLRVVEGRMYIASSDAAEVLNVIVAYREFMRGLGVRRVEITGAEPGSAWVKFKQWTKAVADKRKVRVAATQLVGLVEGSTTEKFQADNTATHAGSVANLADKTKHLKSFSFDSEPLQYVQWQDENGEMHARARVVSSKDIASNRLDDEVVKDPKKMLDRLDEAPDVIRPKLEG